jgi:outer membrane protein OmpA-like peptidoglycan-associated protein
VNVQTNIEYLKENFASNQIKTNVDTLPFFAEIAIDTTGLYKRYLEEKENPISASDEDEAARQIEWLLSLNFNTSEASDNDPAVRNITSEGFSIIPQTGYDLKVSKINANGQSGEQVTIPLTKGVKYDFSSNPYSDKDYEEKLSRLMAGNHTTPGTNEQVIDISILSKDLEMMKGEEFSFSLLPDSASMAEIKRTGNPMNSTLIIDNKPVDISSNDKIQLHVPYSSEGKVNIQTDLAYVEKNFASENYNVQLDTIPFFAEIAIDTTGLYKRYMDEASSVSKKQPMQGFNEINPARITYRVQIAALNKPATPQQLADLYSGDLEINVTVENGYYKYYIAEKQSYIEAKIILDACGVTDAFIAAYESGKRVGLKNAILRQYMERMAGSGITLKDSVINVVTLNFEFNRYTLRPNDEYYINELLVKELNKNSDYYLVINGHTDIRGSKSYNYTLAEERAECVKQMLIQRGVDKKRIKTFSFGEDQVLKACNSPESCDESVHQVNRRVEIIIFAPKK